MYTSWGNREGSQGEHTGRGRAQREPGVSAICPQTGLSKCSGLASGSTCSYEESQCWVPFPFQPGQKLRTETRYKGYAKLKAAECRHIHKFLGRSSGNVKRSLSSVILLVFFLFSFFPPSFISFTQSPGFF